MTKKQLEIDNLIKGKGLKYSFVARSISITRQTLDSQLKRADEIKLEYYIKIKNCFGDINDPDESHKTDKPTSENQFITDLEPTRESIKLKDKIITLLERKNEQLEVKCHVCEKELIRLNKIIKQLQKECSVPFKKGCLVKNIKIRKTYAD